jgi:hypothetical protein
VKTTALSILTPFAQVFFDPDIRNSKEQTGLDNEFKVKEQ